MKGRIAVLLIKDWIAVLLRKLLQKLSSLNPVSVWREEKERDRQLIIACVQEASAVFQSMFRAQEAQVQMMKDYLGQFRVDGPTTTRVVSETEELERVAASLGMSLDEYLSRL